MGLLRVLALVGLGGSTALLVNYLWPNPQFCRFDSGCGEVLSSAFGRPLGVPLPVVGVVAFGTIFGLSLAPAGRSLRLLRWLSWGAGAGGLALFLIQVFLLRVLCPYCVVVDLLAVAMAVLLLIWHAGPLPEVQWRPLWLVAALVAVGLSAAPAALRSESDVEDGPPPPQVAALYVPGKINVVEVTDFDCRHCRRMHAVMKKFLAEEGDRVHFVRLTVPLPVNQFSRSASRAYVCACEQGKGDEMAEALFRSPEPGIAECGRLASSLGLSMPTFEACIAAPATDGRLDEDIAWVRVAGRAPSQWFGSRIA